MCFGSGADRKRAPWWRTTRAFITTRRAFDRSRIETAARRPRPNRDRLRPWLDGKLLPTCPAFFAARITSPIKVSGRLAPRLPCWMRPGRTRRSSSRVVMARVLGQSVATALGCLKSLDDLAKAPAGCVGGVGKFLNLPNHMRRTAGRPFPLPSVGWVPVPPLHHTQTSATARQSMIICERAHCGRSLDDNATNSPSDCGASAVQSCAERSIEGRDDCGVGAEGVSLGGLDGREGNNDASVQDFTTAARMSVSSVALPPTIGARRDR